MHEENKVPFLLTIPLGVLCALLLALLRLKQVECQRLKGYLDTAHVQTEDCLQSWNELFRITGKLRLAYLGCKELHQGFNGARFQIRNKFWDCDFEIRDADRLELILDFCGDPYRRHDVLQRCTKKFGNRSCSAENSVECDNLLICHSGKWEINNEEALLHERARF